MSVKKTNPLIKILMVLAVIILLGIGFIVVFSSGADRSKDQQNQQNQQNRQNQPNQQKQKTLPSSSKIEDSAAADTSVETLKTLTSELTAVEQQNTKIIAENDELKQKDKNSLAQLKEELLKTLTDTVHQTVQSSLESPEQDHHASTAEKAKEAREAIEGNSDDLPVNEENTSPAALRWISDMQINTMPVDKKHPSTLNEMAALLNPNVLSDASLSSKLSSASSSETSKTKKSLPEPYYTLPIGSTLTGAILMEPLIGRIPINGRVPDPYHFKVILGPKNLAANGIDIPPEVQGIVATGYTTGDMLRSCAMGKILTMTFVFPDGRISTTANKDDEGLGYISATSGDPCLAGSFHTNAAEYLGGSAVLAGVQGYASALAQAQTMNTMSQNGAYPSVSTIVKNGNQYALGQGVAAGAQDARTWWNQRVQSSFDFVYVPNIDEKTGALTKVDIHIMQPVAIDYDFEGRKVRYDHKTNSNQSASID